VGIEHSPIQSLANALRARLPAPLYLWICDRLYHEAAFAYDWVAALVSGGRWRAWGERAARGLRGRVVEVGPGPGHLLGALRRRGVGAVGVELSPVMAARTARISPGAVARGDGRALPIRDGAVDALLLTFPAQYALSPAFWSEAARVVRPGGRLRVLLEAGPAYGSAGSSRVRPPAGQWRARHVRVPVGDATLGMLVAIRRRRFALPSRDQRQE
jgi:SAM-dependent methyltransferase